MSVSQRHVKSLTTAHAFRETIPVFFAYFPLGLVFGIIFVQKGFDWYLAPLMSLFVYGGAVQFLALTMVDNHASLLAIVVASSFVAFRNSFYGLSFIERFRGLKFWQRAILIFGLVDAVYAIYVANEKESTAFYLSVSLIIYAYWIMGTLIGALFADVLPAIHGLDFILPSFFMVLVIEFYLKNRDVKALLVPIAASVVTFFLLPRHYLVLAILACLIFSYTQTAREQG